MLILFTCSWRSQGFQFIVALVAEHLMLCSLVLSVPSFWFLEGFLLKERSDINQWHHPQATHSAESNLSRFLIV